MSLRGLVGLGPAYSSVRAPDPSAHLEQHEGSQGVGFQTGVWVWIVEWYVQCFAVAKPQQTTDESGCSTAVARPGGLASHRVLVGFRQLSDCNQAIRQLTKLMLLHVARYYSTVTSLLNLVYTDSGKGPVL